MATATEVAYIQNELGWMVGKTIAKVRLLRAEELLDYYWEAGYGEVPIIVEFTDGTAFVPSQDSEINGPGFLLSLKGNIIDNTKERRMIWVQG